MTGGGLHGVMPLPFSKVYLFDHKRNAAVFDKDVEIPLAPFNGVNGTRPPDSEAAYRVDFQVAQVVDKTLGIHALIAKKLFVNGRDACWYCTPRF